jgi:hypothetical protein
MSMVVIRCTECFIESRVPATCIAVTATAGDQETESEASWLCLACSSLVRRPIGEPETQALALCGAWVIDRADEKLPHPEDPPGGGAFTPDDLLEFHELLTDSVLEQLLNADRHA